MKAKIMEKKINQFFRKISNTRIAVLLSPINYVVVSLQIFVLRLLWFLSGKKKPKQEDVHLVKEQVTFIYKSFERQKMAKRLYRNIQSYYPGVKVIIADDSAIPLNLVDEHVEVIQLPFNSGLSFGLNRALEKVTTPFVIRMDDDELLTPNTCFHEQLKFLLIHENVALVGILPFNLPQCRRIKKAAAPYLKESMKEAPKPLLIPHMTKIDETHVVVGKTPNRFIARTDKIRSVGYDDNIRMIDHHEFFYRAAGNIVSVLDTRCYVIHYHNWFDQNYKKYRSDYQGDVQYIRQKRKELEQRI